jgi:hypothetical protein
LALGRSSELIHLVIVGVHLDLVLLPQHIQRKLKRPLVTRHRIILRCVAAELPTWYQGKGIIGGTTSTLSQERFC